MTKTIAIHPDDPNFRGLVEELSKRQISVQRLAYAVGLHPTTLTKWLEQNEDLRFAREKGLSSGQQEILEKQIEVALDGNPQLLIWLGKQLLGQKEPEKNIKVEADGRTAAQAQAWIEMVKSSRQIEAAVDSGVPRGTFNKPMPIVTAPREVEDEKV